MTSRCQTRVFCLTLLVVESWCLEAWAYRPFDGTDADVAAYREVELEVGPAGYRQEGASKFLVAPALVANYGFAPNFEAVLAARQDIPLGVGAGRPLSRVNDIDLFVKTLLRRGSLQGHEGVSVAVETGLLLPGLEARFGAHVASIMSLQWPALSVHLNLENDFLCSIDYEARVSLIVEGPQAWSVRPVGELLAERQFGLGVFSGGLRESVLVGGIGRWNEAWSFDAAVLAGRAGKDNEREARLGLTWAFEAR